MQGGWRCVSAGSSNRLPGGRTHRAGGEGEASVLGRSDTFDSAAAEGTQARLQSWQVRMRELRFGRRIGRGSTGEVYDGFFRGQNVAIKKLQAIAFRDKDLVERFRDEIYLLSTVTHPNVLVFVGAVLDRPAGNLCLVTELCRRGNLASFLRSPEPIPWGRRIQMASDIARGMHYLHGRAGIIQRDLKSANLLLDDFYRVKIADFGLSRSIHSVGVMDTYCGTPATMAPEIVMQQDYDEKADVFSFAIIMWELLTREEPYSGKGGLSLAMHVAQSGLRPAIPLYCPAEWAFVMRRAWDHDPAARPGFDEILDTLLGMQRLCDEAIAADQLGPKRRPPPPAGSGSAKEPAGVGSDSSDDGNSSPVATSPSVRGAAGTGSGTEGVAVPGSARARRSSLGDDSLGVAAAYQSVADIRRRAGLTSGALGSEGGTAERRRRSIESLTPRRAVDLADAHGMRILDE